MISLIELEIRLAVAGDGFLFPAFIKDKCDGLMRALSVSAERSFAEALDNHFSKCIAFSSH